MGKILFTIIFFVACLAFRGVWNEKQKTAKDLRDVRKSLESVAVDKSIQKAIHNSITVDDIRKYIDSINIVNYDSFREYWISQRYMEYSVQTTENGLKSLMLDNKDLTKEQVLSQIRICLESKLTDIKLSEAFTNLIVALYEESEKIERDEAQYHSSFGKEDDSDPELHPIEPKTGESEEDDITERTVDDLLSTGTVEDVEDQ